MAKDQLNTFLHKLPTAKRDLAATGGEIREFKGNLLISHGQGVMITSWDKSKCKTNLAKY